MDYQDYWIFLEFWDNDVRHLILQNHDRDRNYIHNFLSILKKNTTAFQDAWKIINMKNGIFIDIFPLDNIQIIGESYS